MQEITDRVENKRIDNFRKLFIACAAVSVLITLYKVLSANSGQMAEKGWWFDVLTPTVMSIFCLSGYMKLKNRSGQFIEWQADSIIYKLKNNPTPSSIEKIKIKTVSIRFDVIEVTDVHGQTIQLDISDFEDTAKVKIRKNLENQKNRA